MWRSRDALPVMLVVAVVAGMPMPAGAEPRAAATVTTTGSTPAGPARYGIGREARSTEIAGWDIDVRPDGHGLPQGRGTVREGEALYMERCAACHGEFGEAIGRWPFLAGGFGSLKSDDPQRSVGSFWPYASTVYDYIRRAMPYGNAQSLTANETYALTAYILFLNDVVNDENFELNPDTLKTITLPNEANFYDDDREVTEKHFWNRNPCMKDCIAGAPRITGRARVIDVTPETSKGSKVE